MKTAIITILLVITSIAIAQENKTSTDVKGECNATAVGTNIKVELNCENGLSKAQTTELANQYRDILVKYQQGIKDQKLSFKEVIQRLNIIQDGINNLLNEAAGRRLTPNQIKNLKAVAQNVTITPDTLKFDYFGFDPETAAYAHDFMFALGIDPAKNTIQGMRVNTPTGVILEISTADMNSPLNPVCAALDTYFNSEHIAYISGADPGVPPGKCALMIGLKPVPRPPS
jgi:hypothetical protein